MKGLLSFRFGYLEWLLILSLAVWLAGCKPKYKLNNQEPIVKGLVPDQQTAITIAEAIWKRQYGDKIYDQKPFRAHYNLKENQWIVMTTPQERGVDSFDIELDAKDGRVIGIGTTPNK